MILPIIILSIIITLFEISLREIVLFQYVALLFITVNVLYWFKHYNIAIIVGLIVGVFVDLFLQDHFGETLFALFAPLLILTFFDSLLRIEGRLNRLFFSIVGVGVSIFVSEVLFKLVFWNGNINIPSVVSAVLVSVLVVLVVNLSLGRYLLAGKKDGSYL